MAKPDNDYTDIHVRAQLIDIGKADKAPEVSAYAFSSEGRLLATASVDAKGSAILKVPGARNVARLRVLVGPKVDKDAADFNDLIRRGAQEKHLRVDAKAARFDVELTIFPDIWRCWLWGFCFVRGNLNKRVLVGGQYENFPVCNATVEVYEVDPIWIIIPKLPDLVLDRLRHIIVDPRPIPIPVPEPGPDPAPFARAAMLQEQAEFRHRLDADSADTLRQIAQSTDLRYAAQLGSKLQFQQALIDNAKLVRPLLCLFYPLLVTKQLVATAQTDECGHFQTLFFKGCHNPDTPDLYFKAKQKLFGFFDVYVYAPTPVACYTWWNYACGTEVNLFTSSPWAHTCSPCPPVVGPDGKNRWVAFLAIGAHGLNNIYGTAQDLAGSTTPANIGLTQAGAPWGSMLLPRLEFSNDLEAAGVRYYQLSWRKGSSGAFLPLIGQVHHYYRHDVSTPTGNMPAWTPELLGPIPVDDGAGHEVPNMFKIPYPSVAPAGVWDTPPDINEIKEHFASAKFPSVEIAPGMHYDATGTLVGSDTSGKYEIKVDLFDNHGQPVNIGALGIVYAVPTDPDGTGTVNTVDASTLGLVSGNSMVITLHVDNNGCFADIAAPTIAATPADPCCGVLKYHAGDSVTMAWQALHPHNFATYSFGVVRGIQSVISESGPVAASTSPKVQTVDHLLNDNLPVGCPVDGCTVAGFSENLYVDGTASDGWGADLYNASFVRAFVLAKA
ncbi:MAG TPA: hypothetical protein VMT98_16730 [Verrucomicrobiae bacterium]|nr:hypothetical protein [Verrucomicrobiae bacterium]